MPLWPTPSWIASFTMPIACSSAATACENNGHCKPSPLDPVQSLWRNHFRPAGAPPPRPTSIGTAGRLRSEQVADINRNARPTSSESAHLVTNVTTCSAMQPDMTSTAGIHESLAARGLLPIEHFVDSGYVDAGLL